MKTDLPKIHFQTFRIDVKCQSFVQAISLFDSDVCSVRDGRLNRWIGQTFSRHFLSFSKYSLFLFSFTCRAHTVCICVTTLVSCPLPCVDAGINQSIGQSVHWTFDGIVCRSSSTFSLALIVAITIILMPKSKWNTSTMILTRRVFVFVSVTGTLLVHSVTHSHTKRRKATTKNKNKKKRKTSKIKTEWTRRIETEIQYLNLF